MGRKTHYGNDETEIIECRYYDYLPKAHSNRGMISYNILSLKDGNLSIIV
jgi:hypothetical protein